MCYRFILPIIVLLLACNGKNKEQDGTLTLYPLQRYDEYDNSRIRQIKDPLKRYILQKTHLNLKNENQNPALIKIKFKS